MSEQNQETTAVDVKQEREALKARCQLLGIQTQGNQSNETLRALIRAKQDEMDAAARQANPAAFDEAVETSEVRTPSLREYLKTEALKLVRVRISCMNPQLAKMGSVIITTGNEYTGTVRKVVFFGEKTENGYHIPQIILNVLQRRKFQQVVEERNHKGHLVPRARWMKEFNIEILPPLTQKELNALKDRQLATNSID
jgi:hypothetical protein